MCSYVTVIRMNTCKLLSEFVAGAVSPEQEFDKL